MSFSKDGELDRRADRGPGLISEQAHQLPQRRTLRGGTDEELVTKHLIVEGDVVAHVGPHLEQHDPEVALRPGAPIMKGCFSSDGGQHSGTELGEGGELARNIPKPRGNHLHRRKNLLIARAVRRHAPPFIESFTEPRSGSSRLFSTRM